MNRIFIFILLFFVSCTAKWDLDQTAVPTMVVEGWIEMGKPATVILSRQLPFKVESGAEEDFKPEDLPLKWATVKLSDGENEEILVGMYDEDYFPPYVYVGSDIIGEEGKTYKLSVKYPQTEVTAVTSMPKKIEIERLDVNPNSSNPDQFSIRIHFKDDINTDDYYKVFTRIRGEDTQFYPSFMGNVTDDVFPGGNCSVVVNRAFRNINMNDDAYSENPYSPYFSKEDTVSVKLARLPKEAYDFWDSYDNGLTNGANVLFPSSINLKSNIHGGNGIWCAYAVDVVDAYITH